MLTSNERKCAVRAIFVGFPRIWHTLPIFAFRTGF